MPRGHCRHHGGDLPCSCAMGNLYRFVEPLALFLLKKHGRAYGYELLGSLRDNALTDSEVEPGALYRTLRRLEQNGFVTLSWAAGGAGPARRLYELNEAGEEHLREWTVVMDHMAQATTRFVSEARELLIDTETGAASLPAP